MKLYKLDFDDIIDLLVDEDKKIRKLAFKLLQKEERFLNMEEKKI